MSQAKAYLVPLDETTEIHDSNYKVYIFDTSEYILLFKTAVGTLPLHISGKKKLNTFLIKSVWEVVFLFHSTAK